MTERLERVEIQPGLPGRFRGRVEVVIELGTGLGLGLGVGSFIGYLGLRGEGFEGSQGGVEGFKGSRVMLGLTG